MSRAARRGHQRPGEPSLRVYGRMPVLEALLDHHVDVRRVVLARSAHGSTAEDILAAAATRGVRVERADADKVARLSGAAHQDQGAVAEVAAPGLDEVDRWLAAGPPAGAWPSVVVLDGVSTPGNIGMVVRSAAAADVPVVLPRRGSPELGPLVVKASAGALFRARLLRADTAAGAVGELAAAGFTAVGLRAGAGASLLGGPLPLPACVVLGSEAAGLSPAVEAAVEARGTWRHVPMANGVESLNVAVTAALACFEIARRRPPAGP